MFKRKEMYWSGVLKMTSELWSAVQAVGSNFFSLKCLRRSLFKTTEGGIPRQDFKEIKKRVDEVERADKWSSSGGKSWPSKLINLQVSVLKNSSSSIDLFSISISGFKVNPIHSKRSSVSSRSMRLNSSFAGQGRFLRGFWVNLGWRDSSDMTGLPKIFDNLSET